MLSAVNTDICSADRSSMPPLEGTPIYVVILPFCTIYIAIVVGNDIIIYVCRQEMVSDAKRCGFKTQMHCYLTTL